MQVVALAHHASFRAQGAQPIDRGLRSLRSLRHANPPRLSLGRGGRNIKRHTRPGTTPRTSRARWNSDWALACTLAAGSNAHQLCEDKAPDDIGADYLPKEQRAKNNHHVPEHEEPQGEMTSVEARA